eukprot:UN19331
MKGIARRLSTKKSKCQSKWNRKKGPKPKRPHYMLINNPEKFFNAYQLG